MLARKIVLCILSVCFLSSCSGKKTISTTDKVPVVPVSGIVTVDGASAAGVKFQCIPQGDFAVKGKENLLRGSTDDTGAFRVNLYQDEKGIPPGEYALTFVWPTESMKKRSKKKEVTSDRLNGKYADAKKSPLKFKVESGKPLELEPIQLKTK